MKKSLNIIKTWTFWSNMTTNNSSKNFLSSSTTTTQKSSSDRWNALATKGTVIPFEDLPLDPILFQQRCFINFRKKYLNYEKN